MELGDKWGQSTEDRGYAAGTGPTKERAVPPDARREGRKDP